MLHHSQEQASCLFIKGLLRMVQDVRYIAECDRHSLQLKMNTLNYNPKTMKSAMDVARYFLCRVDREIEFLTLSYGN